MDRWMVGRWVDGWMDGWMGAYVGRTVGRRTELNTQDIRVALWSDYKWPCFSSLYTSGVLLHHPPSSRKSPWTRSLNPGWVQFALANRTQQECRWACPKPVLQRPHCTLPRPLLWVPAVTGKQQPRPASRGPERTWRRAELSRPL